MHRYTFHFSNISQGWSETFFRALPFNTSDTIFLSNYIQKRLELLSTTCFMVSARASNVDTKRDITIFPLPSGGAAGTWAYGGDPGAGTPGAPTATEDSFTALLLRLNDGGTNYRTFPLLGLPDHVLAGSQIVPMEEALVRGRLNSWIGAINSASFGMKAQGAPAASGRILTFEDKTATNQLVCLGISGAPPAVGSIITLGAVKPFNKLNRQWRVAQVIPASGADPAFIYLARSGDLNVYGPVEGGTWKAPTFTLAVLNSYTISRLTSRKTGVPFDTVRGRR